MEALRRSLGKTSRSWDAPPNGCAIVSLRFRRSIQRLNQERPRPWRVANARASTFRRSVPIRWLTSNAARALGIADRVGTLEPGKLANVVLWKP